MNIIDPSIISYSIPEWDRVSYTPSIVASPVVGYGYEAESDSIRKRRIPL